MSETKVFLIFKGDQPYQGKYSDTSPYGECSLPEGFYRITHDVSCGTTAFPIKAILSDVPILGLQ